MASPQPPPGPYGSGSNDGSGDHKASTGTAAQPVLDIFGGDAYAAMLVCALLVMGMTQGI